MRNWLQTHPFVLLLLPLIAGIVLCNSTGFPFDLLRDTEINWLDSTATFAAVVEEYPVERAKSWRCTAGVYYIYNKESVPQPTKGTVYLYLAKDSTRTLPDIGDCLLFCTTVTRTDSLGSFDYGTYLRRQGIAGQAYVRSCDWSVIGHVKGDIYMLARRVQHRLVERYRELGISSDELGTLAALTLGYREDLDPDIKRSFQRSGASHILAVSGLHTGIIYSVLLALLTCFGRFNPRYENRLHRTAIGLILVVTMMAYALLTGLSPSVVRSVLMLILIEVAYMTYRNPIGLNSVAAAAFLILVFRPLDLFSVSFQLSFTAVTAIICFTPWFIRIMPVPPYKWYTQPLNAVRGLVAASLAAQIGTLPITLYYFHQTCNYFILTNLAVIPLGFCITVFAFATLTVGWIPVVGSVLAYPLYWLTWLLNHYTAFIESLPSAFSVLPGY